MSAQTFNCPNCGAPLDYQDSEASTVRCPFCETSVIVPEELRPAKSPQYETITVSFANIDVSPKRSKAKPAVAILVSLLVLLFVLGIAILPSILENLAANGIEPTTMTLSEFTDVPTSEPSSTPQPSPTPGFASAAMSFGESGIGAGMFSDARYIAVDGSGTIYVGDYQGGRVQAFDPDGKYLHQWKVGDSKTIILGMAASHNGEVFVASGQEISQFDGRTGKLLGKLSSSNGGEFGDLYATPYGGLAAVWYEGRWGMITSLEGHREDLVLFDDRGKIVQTIPSLISGQTEELALDIFLAVDGMGNIFVLSDGLVYQFSPEGRFINRIGSLGSQPGQFSSPGSIAVDGQGRLFIGDSRQIHVFSSEQQYLTSFPIDVSVDSMTFDEKGGLWVVSRDKVTKLLLNRKFIQQ